ncbi:hypothetical protein JTB14_026643 [Gonioctena quinquepunctata]|nr:hypothetical protein JTB14_026643 [Gonioctena quinquepunctata]
MSCSCKAGNTGRCKHISAVLKCSRSDLQELELICQTDLKCVGNRQKHTTREKYRAVPIKDMPCFTKKVEEHVNISFDEKEMLNLFIAKLPNSAISKHSVGRRSVNEQWRRENQWLYWKLNACMKVHQTQS